MSCLLSIILITYLRLTASTTNQNVKYHMMWCFCAKSCAVFVYQWMHLEKGSKKMFKVKKNVQSKKKKTFKTICYIFTGKSGDLRFTGCNFVVFLKNTVLTASFLRKREREGGKKNKKPRQVHNSKNLEMQSSVA